MAPAIKADQKEAGRMLAHFVILAYPQFNVKLVCGGAGVVCCSQCGRIRHFRDAYIPLPDALGPGVLRDARRAVSEFRVKRITSHDSYKLAPVPDQTEKQRPALSIRTFLLFV